jgi:hypothetical protein
MAGIATEARPALVGALIVTLALWLARDPSSSAAVRAAFAPTQPRVIVPLTIEPLPRPADADVGMPVAHPDARPWPLGMVIGTPAIDEPIQLRQSTPSLVDRVLQALVGPWLRSSSS